MAKEKHVEKKPEEKTKAPVPVAKKESPYKQNPYLE